MELDLVLRYRATYNEQVDIVSVTLLLVPEHRGTAYNRKRTEKQSNTDLEVAKIKVSIATINICIY